MNIIAGNQNYNFAHRWLPSGVTFTRGRGSRLWDTDGREWLDFYCNFGANIIGHGNREYVDRINQAMLRQSSVAMSDLCLAAADKINCHYPSMEMLRFAMTGTEVVQTAFRLSRAYTSRRKILRFTGHYHGHADNILGGTFDGAHDYPVVQPDDARASKGTIPEERIHDTLIVPWNDTQRFEAMIRKYSNEIACVILEPLNMNSGAIEISAEFLKAIERACHRDGIVMVFDEIITGNRAGIGGMQSILNVRPDLTLLGKTLSGGMLPVSAVGGNEKIMSLLENCQVVQAGTFNGYHAGMAAVLSAYHLLEKPEGLDRMYEKGRNIRQALEEQGRQLGFPVVTQGCDGCFFIHPCENKIVRPEQWTKEMKKTEAEIQKRFFRHQICVAPPLRFYLNIDVSDSEIEQLLRVSYEVFQDVRDGN